MSQRAKPEMLERRKLSTPAEVAEAETNSKRMMIDAKRCCLCPYAR